MKLYQLNSFVELARIGNLTRTAKILNISLSALSSQISNFEDNIGLQLFERTTKGMCLNSSGELILQHAEEVMRAWNNLFNEAKYLNNRICGTVTIGLNTDPSFLKVRSITNRLLKTYPDLSVIFQSSQTIHTSEKLLSNQIDIGFCFGSLQEKDLVIYEISQIDICVVIPTTLCSNITTLTWQELADMPWIWSDCGCPHYVLFQKEFERFNLKPNQRINAVDEHIIQELVKEGQGVALLREDHARSLEADNYVNIWEGKRVSVPLNIAWMKKRVGDNKIDAVIQKIKECWELD